VRELCNSSQSVVVEVNSVEKKALLLKIGYAEVNLSLSDTEGFDRPDEKLERHAFIQQQPSLTME
jgi:hypothetical protein